MTENRQNRRVRMTKRLMQEALLEHLELNTLENITITSLCDTADVNRSTFYKYYKEPADLLKEIEQDFLDRIPAAPVILNLESQEQLLNETTGFFDYVKDNERVVRVLFSDSAGNRFAARLVDFICSQNFELSGDLDEAASLFIHLYIANGTVGMLRDWVNKGFPVSSREIAEMMFSLSRKLTQ